MLKLMRDSLCIPSADIVQPVLLVFVSSCINIKCSKLLNAVLNRNDIVVANMLVDKMIYTCTYCVFWLMFAFRRRRGAHSVKFQATSLQTVFNCQQR